jgi:hypothetical protein
MELDQISSQSFQVIFRLSNFPLSDLKLKTNQFDAIHSSFKNVVHYMQHCFHLVDQLIHQYLPFKNIVVMELGNCPYY